MNSFNRVVSMGLLALSLACSTEKPKPGRQEVGRLEAVTRLPQDPMGLADGWLDFGTVAQGESREFLIVFRNAGEAPIELPIPQPGPPFSVERQGDELLPPGEEGSLIFRYTSPADGESSSRAVVTLAGWNLALTGASSPCSLEISREAIDFGSSPPGVRLKRELLVENVGQVACTLSKWAIQGSDDFTVGASGRWVVAPGTKTPLPLVFQATEPGMKEAALIVDTSVERIAIPLIAEARSDCIVWSDVPELHEAEVGCAVSNRLVRATNVCTNILRLGPITIEPDDAFQLIRISTDLFSDVPAIFEYRFLPHEAGTHKATIELRSGPEVVVSTLDLVGEAGSGLVPHSVSWRTKPLDPLDVLVVVDDTVAMATFDKQRETFLQELSAQLAGHDFRLAFVTTSTLEGDGPGCPAGGGRLLEEEGRPAILTPLMADWLEVAQNRLEAIPNCHTSSRGLDAVTRVIENNPNGFFRDETYRWYLFLAASEDTSPQTVSFYQSRFTGPFLVELWSGPGSCVNGGSRWADFGDRVIARRSSICRTPWVPVSDGPQGGPSRTFLMTQVPVDVDGDGVITEVAGEMEVTIDGVPLPQFEAGRRQWSYQPSLNSLRLELPILPHAGELVTATFNVWCGA